MRAKPAESKIFYGWYIIILGTVGVLMSAPGQTIGISTFTDYLIDSLNLTRNQLSVAYMFGTVCSSLLLTYGGKMYDRYGARLIAFTAACGMGLTLFYLSYSDRISGFLCQKITFIPGWTISFTILFAGFFLIRFFGQGILTLSSKNMIMEWFEHKRGLANSLSSPFIVMGFSTAPLLFNNLISTFGWQGAWRMLALIAGFLFPIIILIFYYDKPEKAGLKPDGNISEGDIRKSLKKNSVHHQFTLKNARKQFSFWVYVISLSMFAFYITGLTFNIVSVFEKAGFSRETALTIFIPVSIIAFVLNVMGNRASDYIQLKHLYKLMAAGGIISAVGVIYLNHEWAYWILIIGNGIMSGMFGILTTITWPKYFGRKHLGEISGFNQSINVFFSAVAPWAFSFTLSFTSSYYTIALITLSVWSGLFLASFFTGNPQSKFA